MALAAAKEPKNETREEVKRLRKVVRESGLLFLRAEPDDPGVSGGLEETEKGETDGV